MYYHTQFMKAELRFSCMLGKCSVKLLFSETSSCIREYGPLSLHLHLHLHLRMKPSPGLPKERPYYGVPRK